ncbi:MAG: NAD(P)/FAD-dependent oxidoreductase [Methanosarcinaceae archaeon]|nr:NAD(P)/FAD-dependent oxidoreductase [Methanosarcinaceae archaeon]
MKNGKKAVIIGSGLGGLLTGASLAKDGWSVEIYERLSLIGGRFSNIDYKGYQLTTGALHMVPNAPNGPLLTMLKRLGANVTVVPSDPLATIRNPLNPEDEDYKSGYKDIHYLDLTKHMSFKNKAWMAILTFCFNKKLINPGDKTFVTWFSKYIDDKRIVRYADSFAGWSLSLKADEVPATEMLQILENIVKYGGPAMIMGGCSSVISELVRIIESNGGKIYTNKEIVSVNISKGSVESITVRDSTMKDLIKKTSNDTEVKADLFISNIGHKETFDLYEKLPFSPDSGDENKEKEEFNLKYEKYINELKGLKASAGIKISFAADEQLIEHTGVLFTPYARRVCALNSITTIDPTMAPPGKHLIMSHQRVGLDKLDDIESEIELGLEDLKDLFSGKEIEILAVQVHHGEWPVNRCFSGYDIGNKTPYSNLYIVGDGAKGEGGIEIEGITLGVEKALSEINKLYN